MSKQLTRRDFGKLAVTSVGAAAAAAAGLGIEANTAEAFAPGFIDRWRGPVYTSGGLNTLQDCIAHGGYNMKKVVTAWPSNPWSQSDITTVTINIPGTTLVRSNRGDGSANGRPPEWAYPIGADIVNEIRPWYNTQNWIWIELGNEPNGYTGWVQWAVNTYGWARDASDGIPPQLKPATYDSRADQFIWNWRFYLNDAITQCQQNFQTRPVGQARATIVSPGLSAINPARWFAIAGDVMSRCDYIGFHVFTNIDFYGSADLNQIVPLLGQYFPNKNLLMTEYGINDTKVTSDATKGRRYAEFLHFNKSGPYVLPGNTRGGLYYHRSITLETNYDIYSAGDDAYKTRITTG